MCNIFVIGDREKRDKGTEWEAVIAEEYEYVNKEYENVK